MFLGLLNLSPYIVPTQSLKDDAIFLVLVSVRIEIIKSTSVFYSLEEKSSTFVSTIWYAIDVGN